MDKHLTIIQSKIYEIRGQKVMLDFDLAEIYQVETKRLKESVRRNMDRFEGEDFMIILSKDEIEELSRTQIASLNKGRGYNIKHSPFAFTEYGVAMLCSVLNSKLAIEMNRNIIRAFIAMRQQLLAHPSIEKVGKLEKQMSELKEYIEEVFTDYNDINDDTRIQLEMINQTLAELQTQKKLEDRPRNPIGFKK